MASSFLASLDRSIQRVKQETNDKVVKISIDLFKLVVEKSPSPDHPGEFAKGLLVNQWYPHIGAGFSADLGTSISNDGAASRSRIDSLRGTKEFFGKNGRVSLTNNVKYAYRAEAIGWPKDDPDMPPGWHWTGRVGPYRMVALSLLEIKSRL